MIVVHVLSFASTVAPFRKSGPKHQLAILDKLGMHIYTNYEKCFSRPGVPNLSFTMYPFSIPTDEHVPLQHFNR